MDVVRKIVFILLRLTLVPFLIREIVQRKKVTIIFYHNVDVSTAENHFKLLKSKYNIITLREFVNAKNAGTVKKLPPKSLIITFDDGHKNNFRLVPLFNKYRIPATVFVCSGIVGTNRHFWFKHSIQIDNEELKNIPDRKRLDLLKHEGFEEKRNFKDRQALSKDEIANMRRVVDFQSHTVFHPILPECAIRKSNYEIENSKKTLEDSFGLEIYALCYPNGDYSQREIFLAKRAGYECALTTDWGFNSQDIDVFRLKRISIRDRSDNHELLVRASGLWDYMKFLVKKGSLVSHYANLEEQYNSPNHSPEGLK